MKRLIIFGLAKYLGFFAVSRWLTRRGLRILGYHGIWLGEGHYGNRLFMSKKKFVERMQALARSCYPVLSLSEAIEKLSDGTLPAYATVITIDDGWHGTYRYMIPALLTAGLPATVYITTYYAEKQTPVFGPAIHYMLHCANVQRLDLSELDDKLIGIFELHNPEQREHTANRIVDYGNEYLNDQERQQLCSSLGALLGIDYQEIIQQRLFGIMSFDEIHDAARSGFDIQLHTHRHRITEKGQDCIEQEISDNRRCLESLTNQPLIHFCYPSGVYQQNDWYTLKKLGIVSATTTEPSLNFAPAQQFALSRILDGEEMHWLELEAELSGFVDLLRRCKCAFVTSMFM